MIACLFTGQARQQYLSAQYDGHSMKKTVCVSCEDLTGSVDETVHEKAAEWHASPPVYNKIGNALKCNSHLRIWSSSGPPGPLCINVPASNCIVNQISISLDEAVREGRGDHI